MATNNQTTPWYQRIDAKKKYRVGTEKKDYAGNRYLYCSGVASTVAGDWVFIDEAGATVRMVTSSVKGPVGIAQAANTSATNYAWYLVWSGDTCTANCVNDTIVDDSGCYVSGTAGAADDDSSAGLSIFGAIFRSANTTTTATVQVRYPFVLGTAAA